MDRRTAFRKIELLTSRDIPETYVTTGGGIGGCFRPGRPQHMPVCIKGQATDAWEQKTQQWQDDCAGANTGYTAIANEIPSRKMPTQPLAGWH